ncbi:ER membrane protein complex subunit 3 [Smittium mucronatum]|uniref:ER membrane protein complex subunit 3 n=1 Tax=Smittium mucronatum TaxID=133383 RepID=A0A1R0H2V3_9FUNG|nr:ER membrane protein complex subunit 3 [Smittium mucronatum]
MVDGEHNRNMLSRANVLIENCKYIPATAFSGRASKYMAAFEAGTYLEFPEKKGEGAPNPMSDPKVMEGMMDGMKQQLMSVIPQTIIMGWIQFFFSGFILTRLPFPLGIKFKSMLQAGISTVDMDVTWVSSLSWYFLNLFGLNGIFGLFLGENSAGGMEDLAAMSGGAGMMQQMQQQQASGVPADFNKIFLAAKENIFFAKHNWNLDNVEDRVLALY